jgi:hypothetical protein
MRTRNALSGTIALRERTSSRHDRMAVSAEAGRCRIRPRSYRLGIPGLRDLLRAAGFGDVVVATVELDAGWQTACDAADTLLGTPFRPRLCQSSVLKIKSGYARAWPASWENRPTEGHRPDGEQHCPRRQVTRHAGHQSSLRAFTRAAGSTHLGWPNEG